MSNQTTNKDEFVVTFRNGALQKLNEVAAKLGVPQDQLGDVVAKGLKLIDYAMDTNGTLIIEKDNNRLEVDLKKL